MDEIKTGLLIREARKKQNLTQKQLAERLNVSVQAVSKWENAKGFPDVSLLEPLSNALELSVSDLVRGEVCRKETPSDSLVKEVVDMSVKQTKKKVLSLKLALAVIILSFLAGVIWWSAPKRFLQNVKAENVACIKVFNGSNGEELLISNPEDIQSFLHAVSSVRMQKTKLSLGYFGYVFRISFEMKDTFRIAPRSFIINSDNTIRQDPFFWQNVEGGLPYEWLLSYVNP